MSKDTVVEVFCVSKKFAKNLNCLIKYGSLDIIKNVLGLDTYSERLRPGEFWAVRDVSFKLKRGESLGLIGPNGSGKTTLLKMINGILAPDKGQIKVEGKVGALIEVGAGFHPLLTGRENIYVNGAILGMSKKEIDKKFDEIVEFSEIGDFLDAPVRTYSSGMFVRLGFSVAAHANQDILLVDEVLAVGDISFQSKCFRKIGKLRDAGISLVLVSQNLELVRHYADKALFINKGKVIFTGNSQEACERYTLQQTQETKVNSIIETSNCGLHIPAASNLQDIKFKIVNSSGKSLSEVKTEEPVDFHFSFFYSGSSDNLQIGIIIYKDGLYLVGIDSLIDGLKLSAENELFKGVLRINRVNLTAGQYTAVLAIINRGDFLFRGHPINFSVVSKRIYPGFLDLPHEWKISCR